MSSTSAMDGFVVSCVLFGTLSALKLSLLQVFTCFWVQGWGEGQEWEAVPAGERRTDPE